MFNEGGVWIFRLLVMGGFLLLAFGLARLFGKKAVPWFLGMLVVFELTIVLLFQLSVSGWDLPEGIAKSLSFIYVYRCTDYTVYDKERGRFDDEIFYTLKPGSFVHSNMEFSNNYHVNSLGVRDDEASLDYPELVFLGDSYTMGWGAEQDESYAAILEKKLGMRGLNTGIASYGTAREYLTFQRLKSDSCRLLVLQFCPNDVRENHAYVQAGHRLEVSPKAVFEKELVWNKLHRSYYPFKYLHAVVFFVMKKIKPGQPASPGIKPAPPHGIRPSEVEDFFTILKKIKKEYTGPIIVFNLGMGETVGTVTAQFENWLSENPMPGVHVFPASEYLSKKDYLPLDTHLTVEGNRKLAEGLEMFLRD